MLGNVPVSKDLLISFVIGIEMSLQISFKIPTLDAARTIRF